MVLCTYYDYSKLVTNKHRATPTNLGQVARAFVYPQVEINLGLKKSPGAAGVSSAIKNVPTKIRNHIVSTESGCVIKFQEIICSVNKTESHALVLHTPNKIF